MSLLKFLANASGNTTSSWNECPWYLLQFYNDQGEYEIGDGPEYTMMLKTQQWTPFEYHTQQQPVEDQGSGNFIFKYTGTATILFKTRLKNDQTAVEFRLLINGAVVHTYRTSLVHNGASMDVVMDHSLLVNNDDVMSIVAQAYASTGSAIVSDTDDQGNPNTILKFTFI